MQVNVEGGRREGWAESAQLLMLEAFSALFIPLLSGQIYPRYTRCLKIESLVAGKLGKLRGVCIHIVTLDLYRWVHSSGTFT